VAAERAHVHPRLFGKCADVDSWHVGVDRVDVLAQFFTVVEKRGLLVYFHINFNKY